MPPSRRTLPSLVVPLLTALLIGPSTAATHAQAARPSVKGTEAAPRPSAADIERARRVLRSTPLVDGHNDLPWAIRESSKAPHDVEAYDLRKTTAGHTDLARLTKGMVGAQFWSVYTPGEYADSGYARVQLEQIDIARQVIAKYPDKLRLALSTSDVRRDFRDNVVGSLLGLEGGHAIENSLGALRAYYDLGVRYMTLTHNVTLDWADAAMDSAKHGGLTPFGEEVVREMNRLGMLVDLAHVSPGSMSDALNVSQAPVIFSHSGARALVDVPRNVPDSILRRLPKNGGVVMVPFVPSFVSPELAAYEREASDVAEQARTEHPGDTAAQHAQLRAWRDAHPAPRATLSQVADQIEHIRDVAGIDHVGIGSDFDGITEVVVGLEDVSKFPALFAELARRGWSDEDLKKLAGENVLHAFARAEAVSARLRKERPPSNKTIAQLDSATTAR
ncbi:MAG TPA: dipeptidase [Gemmatimonadaceae bacterium]|jgi:membrane dipeptidase|nr:dipeptidase [Gemmatimonadaceae bacterium]